MNISDFDYPLSDERIAKFPVAERDSSKLLVWRDGEISETIFSNIGSVIPPGSLLVFNNTRVVRARLVMHKPVTGAGGNAALAAGAGMKTDIATGDTKALDAETTSEIAKGDAEIASRIAKGDAEIPKRGVNSVRGARIEILCLEPHDPADYERAFAARGRCEWSCMVGGLKKWKEGHLEILFTHNGKEHKLLAWRKLPTTLAGTRTVPEAGAVGEKILPVVKADEQQEQTGNRNLSPNKPGEQIVRFEWDADLTFGNLLELLGRMPIPPYLDRDSEAIDNTRYQTVYSRFEGSVAAPTAGLHFTPELIAQLTGAQPHKHNSDTAVCRRSGTDASLTAGAPPSDYAEPCFSRKIEFDEVTLHVGAGTFLPVKTENALEHPMHTEHFEVTLPTIERLLSKIGFSSEAGGTLSRKSKVIAVGTTSVRTLESLVALGWRIALTGGAEKGSPETERPIGQFELYDIPPEFTGADALQTLADHLKAHGLGKISASTRIMITPGFAFRIVGGIITNFHQPKSTLLLLVSAFVGGGDTICGTHNEGNEAREEDGKHESGNKKSPLPKWRKIYDYALSHDFRFLSYGDSSILLP